MSDDWQVVAEAVGFAEANTPGSEEDASDALARLREREAQLEREVDDAVNSESVALRMHAADEAEYQKQREYADEQYRKALAAEARVARLEEALREIGASLEAEVELSPVEIHGIARRALAHEEEK